MVGTGRAAIEPRPTLERGVVPDLRNSSPAGRGGLIGRPRHFKGL